MNSEANFKVTEIGLIPDEWDIFKLGSLGELRNGVNFNRNDFGEGYPVINVKNLYSGRYATIINLNEIKEGTIKNIQDYKLENGDLLFARSSVKASGAGQVAMVNKLPKKDTLFSGFIIRFRNSSKNLNPAFLNYQLRSPVFRNYLTTIATGTTITNLTQPIISNIPVILPTIEEQGLIVNFISSLDDKIELNHQMNKTLEKITQLIFQHWFVHFEFPNKEGLPYKSSGGEMVDSELGEIPQNWVIKPLDQVANFLNGLALQKYPPKNDNFLPVIKIRELKKGFTQETDKASTEIPPEYIVDDGDVIFSWSGSLELVLWGLGKGALNQHLFKVTSENYPIWFYYYQIGRYLTSFRQIAADKTTTMGHIKRKHLSDALVAVPPNEILNKANDVFDPLFNYMVNNKIQSRYLTLIRDSLLPKLMSGKIRIGNATEADNK